MPLDPLLKAFIDQLQAQPQPKLWEVAPHAGREMFAALMQAVGPKDVPVGRIADFSIPGPRGGIPARSYTPIAAAGEPHPALIFFHGGGFVIGSIETHDGLCRMLADLSACRVISVDYRLAPEHRFPAAIEEAIASLSWIESNASSLGVDANRLAVGGDASGATLAAVVAQHAAHAGTPILAFQILLFPVTHIDADTESRRARAGDVFLDARMLSWFFGHYFGSGDNRADPRASPLLGSDFGALPPAYIMVAGHDPLHDEGVAYADMLRENGVRVILDDYPDLTHDFIYLQAVLPQAAGALRKVAGALKDALNK